MLHASALGGLLMTACMKNWDPRRSRDSFGAWFAGLFWFLGGERDIIDFARGITRLVFLFSRVDGSVFEERGCRLASLTPTFSLLVILWDTNMSNSVLLVTLASG